MAIHNKLMETITGHSRMLAREVIKAACRNYVTGIGPADLVECRDEVLELRFPTRGKGGVAMVNRRTQREIRKAIEEFYQPDDYTMEPC